MADVNYARRAFEYQRHHERFARRVDGKLICQECKGHGGEINVVYMGQGPWEECGWCEGTGHVTPWIRGAWLRYRRMVKPS
jgi:DnaJ-class molecular chaperone